MYKGEYPKDVLELAKSLKLNIDVWPGDAKRIQEAKLGFLGINYYAPFYIKHSDNPGGGYSPEIYFPKSEKLAINGPVRPEQFTFLLNRIRTEYGNPPVIVTENGAGFKGEDKLVNGEVKDVNRCLYLVDHIEAMKKAMSEGGNVQGYHVWSSHDNLEWLSGYASRFGIIYVDYQTQRRIPKLSAKIYSKIIKGEKVTGLDCM